MQSDFASDTRKSAEALFASGLYCAESVVLALAKANGIESNLLPRMATAFCSGMSRTCGTCGAVSGAVMGISLVLGRSEPGVPVDRSYAATQKLIRIFEQEFGSRECSSLLGCDLGTPEGQNAFQQRGLGERCARLTGRAAEIAARLIEEENG